MDFRRTARWVAGFALAACLVACGGGGGGNGSANDTNAAVPGAPTTPATTPSTAATENSVVPDLQKYVGDWLTCLPLGPGSYTQRLAMRVKSATALDVTITNKVMSQPGCAGSEMQTQVTHQVSTFVGAKSIAGDTVDKIGIVYDDGTTFKQVMTVGSGPRLYLGASTEGPFDADGYPERLSTIGRTKG